VCCQIEVSATGGSLVKRIPIECAVSTSDLQTSKMRGLDPLGLHCSLSLSLSLYIYIYI